MLTGVTICPSCGFENPRSFRGCARCGAILGSLPARTGVTALRTIVDRLPAAAEPEALDTEETILDEDDIADAEPAEADAQDAKESEPPLIGQAEPADAIRNGIERAFTVGVPTLTALEGARGSGKTRLLFYAGEIAARIAPDVRVLYASCREGGDGPYAPFSRLLLERFGITPASAPSVVRGQMMTAVGEALGQIDAVLVAETTHLVGHVAGVPFPMSPFLSPLESQPAELKRRAQNAVQKLFEGDAQKRPLLVLLDNFEHAEQDGWDLLAALLAARGHVCVVIAGGGELHARAEKLGLEQGVQKVRVAPFVEADVASMLMVLLPTLTDAPEPLVAALAHRSQGNPSTLRELVFALAESGVFARTEDGSLRVDMARLDAGGLPVSAEDAIRARLARLDAFERATVDRASVMGEVFWRGAVVAQMRGELPAPSADVDTLWADDQDHVELTAALDRLAARGFLVRRDDSDLPGTTEFSFVHAGTHALVYAELSEQTRLSRHAAVARWMAMRAEVSREGIAARIAPHLEKSGQRIRAGRAYLEAAAYERTQMRTASALRFIEKALPLIDVEDIAPRIDALHEHGVLLTTVARYDEAIAAFSEMLQLAWRAGAPNKGGAALNRLARVHRQRGEETKAHALLVRALGLFRAANDVRGIASTLDDLAQVLRLLGETEPALSAATEALELRRANADRRGEAVSLNTLAAIHHARSELELAEQYVRAALTIRTEITDAEGMRESGNMLGILALERGNLALALEAWRTALLHAKETGDRRSQAFLLNNIGEVLTARGELAEARETLLSARELADAIGDLRGRAEVERNVGLVLLALGDDGAEPTLARALRLAEEYGTREAIALAQRAIGRYRAQTMFDGAGAVDKRAEEIFLASIDGFREIGNEKEAARSLADLGFHLLERGETETARERLREARAIMRRVGLADVERLDRTLQELG